MPSYPRETEEFQPINIEGSVSVFDAVEYALTTGVSRPTDWKPTEELGGKTGFMLRGLSPGTYKVWVRVTAPSEYPVLFCGTVTLT